MGDLVAYLGTKKLNELILPNPYNAAGLIDIAAGKHNERGRGFLGQRFRLSEKQGLKLSNTTIGTIYGCEIQFVRIQPDFGTVAITDIIAGRPLFWNDTKKFLVTPLAAITARLAGISLCTLTAANAKGDIIPIVVRGDVGVKMSAAITKAAPAINDPVVMAVAANLGTADVLLDATGWTNVQLAVKMGRLLEALGGGGDDEVHKIYLENAHQVYNDGVM